MKTITIEHDSKTGQVKVDPDPEMCSVKKDVKVRWASDDLEDWCVVFGPQAPLHPKVATPANDTLTLTAKRHEDLRHCKYVVVAWTGDKLKHKDPELIVDI